MIISAMVRFLTLCPKIASTSNINNSFSHQCLTITKGKLVPRQFNKTVCQTRTYAKDTEGKKDPEKEEPIPKIKMPGFVHPETHNEEGYFTQKARQQLKELKKRLDKAPLSNPEKKQ